MMKIDLVLPGNAGILSGLTPKQAGPLLKHFKANGFEMKPEASIVSYETVTPQSKFAAPFGFRYVYRFYRNDTTNEFFGLFIEAMDSKS